MRLVKQTIGKISLAVWVACGVLLANPMVVVAQSGEEATDNVIEEIVVTARKRDETAQEAPVVANIFGEEDIDRYNINSMEDLSQFTPGLPFVVYRRRPPTSARISPFPSFLTMCRSPRPRLPALARSTCVRWKC